jgi:serine protease AprX
LSPTNNIRSDEISHKTISSNYVELSGTSMATPIVSGSIALLIEKYKNLKPDDIKLMLKKSAKDLNYPPNHQGWGLLDVEKLVKQEAAHARK